jgi:MFS superfamily sulfate permease-like transporter
MSHATNGIERHAPALFLPDWLRNYRHDWLRADLVAGIITAAVVIPKAMAYASIAGLPVQVGLYTVLGAMTLYALLGTSRLLSVSTSTTLAILVAADIGPVAASGDAAAILTASSRLQCSSAHFF